MCYLPTSHVVTTSRKFHRHVTFCTAPPFLRLHQAGEFLVSGELLVLEATLVLRTALVSVPGHCTLQTEPPVAKLAFNKSNCQ